MGVGTSAGSKLYIAADAPATFDETGYDAVFADSNAVEVGEITNFGELGREYSEVTHNPVGSRGTQKFKGSFNEGTMSLQLALDETDVGQDLMEAALDSDDDYSFKLELQSGSIRYFQAKVMSFKTNVGDVNSITSASCQLSITTNSDGVGIVKVEASA